MTALHTAQLEKSTLSHRFFIKALVPSWLASAPPSPPRGNKWIAQYDVRSPHTTHLPRYAHVFLLRVSVPFYHHTCTLFYVSKLGYIRACKGYMQPLKCGNSDIFAWHFENRAYGFLAGVWLQQALSTLCLDNLGKFGLILIGASNEANMSASSNSVTTLKEILSHYE